MPSRDRCAAQSLVEFALVAPVFLLLVMGMVDLGRGILYNNMLSNAAREGARAGVLGGTTVPQICDQVVAEVQLPGIGSTSCSSATSDAAWTDGALTLTIHRGTSGSATDPVAVTVDYDFTPITPLIDTAVGLALGGTIQLSASSTMYVEQ